MRAAPRLNVGAPSSRLLRFLRSQSESLCYFTSNPRLCQYQQDGRPDRSSRSRILPAQSQSRRLSSTVARKATLEASLIDFLWPRSKDYTNYPKSSHPNSRFDDPPPTPNTPFHHSRQASTSKHPFLRRWFELKRRKTEPKLEPNDLPSGGYADDGTETSMFNLGRSLAVKASSEPRLRCTEFDENGNVTLVNGEFKKSELIAKYGLLPRDLRKIDSSLLPHILIRPSAILINLLHLRALIKSDRVLVFDAYGSSDSYTQSLFMYDLEGKLRQKENPRQTGALPYEFRALEAILISVTSGLEGEFEGVREPVVRVLRQLEEDIDRDKLRHLLIYSKKLGTFEQKARLVRDAIEDLLDADDDLAAMYLTEQKKGKKRAENDHQEVEVLLESYHKVCDEIVEVSGNLVSNIRNTEEIVRAILDSNRNSLMLLDLKFSIGTLGIASGTLFSALYGMNLKNFFEESDLGFTAISMTCFGLTVFVCAYGLKRLRKLQRVSMWGERGSGATSEGRGNWRDVDPATLGNGWESRYDRTRRLKDPAGAARDAMRRGWITGERERHGSVLKGASEGKGSDGSWAEPLPPAIWEAKDEKAK